MNNFSIGGAETGLLHLLKHNFFEDADVTIRSLFTGTNLLAPKIQAIKPEYDVASLMPQADMSIPKLLQAHAKLSKCVKTLQPDIIICSLPQANILGRIAARKAPKARVVTFEHSVRYAKKIYGTLLKITSANVDMVCYDSEATKDACQQYYPKTAKKIPWHYLPLVSVQGQDKGRTYEKQSEALRLLAVGRLSKEKNHLELVKAVQMLCAKDMPTELHIAGEGDMRAELESLIAESALADQVKLLGFADWKNLCKGFDVFVQPSLREGLCISVIEAMSCALPVVASNVGGMQYYGREGENMLKINGEPSAEAIANVLQKLHDNEALRATIGKQAQTDAIEWFGTERVDVQLKALFKAMMLLQR